MSKIMLVEDDLDNRVILEECLRMEKYDVIAFESGMDALAAIENGIKPDLLLMDLCFPQSSPQDFVNEFRNKTGGYRVPIIVLSGKHDVKKISTELRVNNFLAKPYDIYHLFSEIANSLSSLEEAS